MTLKTVILYLILPIILVLVVYSSQTSYELTGYFIPNNIKNYNNVMIISIDKSSYQQGQTINFTGKVYRYDQGGRIDIRIMDHSKNIITSFNSVLNSYGIFGGTFDIPTTFSNGKYTLDAKYQGDLKGKPLALNMTISNIASGIEYISIPYGSASQSNKLNFDPSTVNIQQGTIISWKNNDVAFHTIFSGKVNDDGSLSLDNHFKDIGIVPGSEVQISLDPGSYSYFCKIHPWLGGFIVVAKNPEMVKTTVKANDTAKTATKPIAKTVAKTTAKPIAKTVAKTTSTTKPFPVQNSVLQTIWKDRKDLQKSYPEAGHGNLVNMTKWATTTGWNQDKRLSALIPPGKVPTYLNSVLQTIWKERTDLQKLYPEVAKGNMINMSKWATTTGFTQYDSLSVLTPPVKVSAKSSTTTKPFPVANSVLQTIWKERTDLQKLYPEVAKGNMINMSKWATTTGHTQYDSLAALTPPVKTTK